MKILIIEDDLDTRAFIKGRLEEKGVAVDEASSGTRGLFAAKSNAYDVILLDYGLPEKDGFQICKELREAGNHTPIIIISVFDETPHKVRGLTVGADDYVTKPFFFDELYARIKTVLRRPQIRRGANISIADLEIDIERQKVMRGNRSIYLTKKEFALLEYLSRNAGDVVSRGMISEHVWDSDINPFSNTIETHVANLRKKIGRKGSDKIIKSIPGRGYLIDPEP